MGFSTPKPDPQLVAEQKAQAALARKDRISLIQQQLDNEDQLRARLYGTRPRSLFGAGSNQPAVMSSGGPSLFQQYAGSL